MLDQIQRLSAENALQATADARIVAIRWDVHPWSLVLDLDAPLSEAPGAMLHRVWLAFLGLDGLCWPFDDSRVPAGVGTTSPIIMTAVGGGFRQYRFIALLPRHASDGSLVGSPSGTVIIRAQDLVGLVSAASAASQPDGSTDWATRVALASDHDLVQALHSAVERAGENEGPAGESA